MFQRTVSRFAAIQAIHQHHCRPDLSWPKTQEEFLNFRFKKDTYELFEQKSYSLDIPFFLFLTNGVIYYQNLLEKELLDLLPKEWSLEQMDSVMRCLFLCALLETMYVLAPKPDPEFQDYLVSATSSWQSAQDPSESSTSLETMLPKATPKPVIFNEYILAAHSFLPEKGFAFVNALLEKFYKKWELPSTHPTFESISHFEKPLFQAMDKDGEDKTEPGHIEKD